MFLFSLLISCVDFYCAEILCGIFLKRKECGRTQKWIILFSAALILTLCNLLQTMPLNPFAYVLLQLIVMRLLFVGTFPIQAALAIFLVALSGILEFLAFQLHLFFNQFSMDILASGSFNPSLIGATLLSKLLLVLLVRIFFFLFKKETYQVADKRCICLLLLPITAELVCYTVIYLQQQVTSSFFNQILSTSIAVLLFAATVAVFWVFDAQLDNTALQLKLINAEAERAAQEDYYKLQEQHLFNLRQFSHDFKNQLITARQMVSRQNTTLQSYLSHLEGEVRAQSNIGQEYSDNRAVNIILYEKQRNCREASIRLVVDAERLSLAFLSYTDACSLFGNAFDNAIRACKEVVNRQERCIHLSILRCNQTVCITMENTRNPNSALTSVQGAFLTTKQDKDAHGYGIYNMTIAAQRYGGRILFDYTDKSFQVVIFLPTPAEGSEKDATV